MRTTCFYFSLVVLISCGATSDGPEKVEIAVTNSPAALTDKSSDSLFKMTLTKTSKSYALADISVDVGLPGETANAVNFTLEDANGNGELDQGESLNCTEPPVNLWDTTTVGKTLTVNFAEKQEGTYFQLGSAKWTPTN